jgi:hypothetical protein
MYTAAHQLPNLCPTKLLSYCSYVFVCSLHFCTHLSYILHCCLTSILSDYIVVLCTAFLPDYSLDLCNTLLRDCTFYLTTPMSDISFVLLQFCLPTLLHCCIFVRLYFCQTTCVHSCPTHRLSYCTFVRLHCICPTVFCSTYCLTAPRRTRMCTRATK